MVFLQDITISISHTHGNFELQYYSSSKFFCALRKCQDYFIAKNPCTRKIRCAKTTVLFVQGGAIGTGLFIGSGGVLSDGGPASLIIGFILIGTMLFNVVMGLGELAVLYPIAGSFSVYSGRFIDPAWGFAMGWNYALQWLVVLPLELTAAAMTVGYWDKTIDKGVWISIFFIVVVFINFFGVKGYGEAEFVFSMVKITAVVGFLILGVVIVVGGAPDHHYYG